MILNSATPALAKMSKWGRGTGRYAIANSAVAVGWVVAPPAIAKVFAVELIAT
jgi:hypothetical protein